MGLGASQPPAHQSGPLLLRADLAKSRGLSRRGASAPLGGGGSLPCKGRQAGGPGAGSNPRQPHPPSSSCNLPVWLAGVGGSQPHSSRCCKRPLQDRCAPGGKENPRLLAPPLWGTGPPPCEVCVHTDKGRCSRLCKTCLTWTQNPPILWFAQYTKLTPGSSYTQEAKPISVPYGIEATRHVTEMVQDRSGQKRGIIIQS